MQETLKEQVFEVVIGSHLLANGYTTADRDGFDCVRAIFPEIVLGFIRETQPNVWKKLEALHGERTGEQIIGDLCKWGYPWIANQTPAWIQVLRTDLMAADWVEKHL